jgi:hypothetical protein
MRGRMPILLYARTDLVEFLAVGRGGSAPPPPPNAQSHGVFDLFQIGSSKLLLRQRSHHSQHAARRRHQISFGVKRKNRLAVRASQRHALAAVFNICAIIFLRSKRFNGFSAGLELDRVTAIRADISVAAHSATARGQQTHPKNRRTQQYTAKVNFHFIPPIQEFVKPNLVAISAPQRSLPTRVRPFFSQ